MPRPEEQLSLFQRSPQPTPARQPMDEASGRARPSTPLEARLSQLCGQTVQVTLTSNRRTFLSYRWPTGGAIQMRLHSCFADAPPPVHVALANFVKNRGRAEARQVLQAHFRSARPPDPPKRRAKPATTSVGRCYDLTKELSQIAEEVGVPSPLPTVGWGQSPRRSIRHHIRLGSYDFQAQHITMHPSLDQASVPRCVLRHVLHHELLHHVFGVQRNGSRRVLHPPELRAMERAFSDFAQAQAWLDANLPKLLGHRPPRRR